MKCKCGHTRDQHCIKSMCQTCEIPHCECIEFEEEGEKPSGVSL